MAVSSVQVEGLDKLIADFQRMDREQKKNIRRQINEGSKIVRDDVRQAFAHVNPRSAMGFRARVRGTSGFVEQRYKTVTGKRGDYGAHQMRYLKTGLKKKEPEVIAHMEKVIDDLKF